MTRALSRLDVFKVRVVGSWVERASNADTHDAAFVITKFYIIYNGIMC